MARRPLRLACAVLCLLGAPACGGGDGGSGGSGFSSDTGCGLSVSVSGALEWRMTSETSTACLTQLGSDTGISVVFGDVGGKELRSFQLRVDAVQRGETGDSLPARVEVKGDDDTVAWTAADCVVNITSNEDQGAEEFGRSYRLEGSGTCPTPAASEGGTTVKIEPFTFVVTVTWSE